MQVGFFFVLKTDPAHYLHAAALVREATLSMPYATRVQLTDSTTPEVPGITRAQRIQSSAPLLEQRLVHYAALEGEWLLIDTDVMVKDDVSDIFDDPVFDVALVDRNWPHLPQGDKMLIDMPFNTGVVFTRCQTFWTEVLDTWQGYPASTRNDWMSEQRAVADVVRSGHYKVKILPGSIYNYPPKFAADVPATANLAHFKGPERKAWRSMHARQTLAAM